MRLRVGRLQCLYGYVSHTALMESWSELQQLLDRRAYDRQQSTDRTQTMADHGHSLSGGASYLLRSAPDMRAAATWRYT